MVKTGKNQGISEIIVSVKTKRIRSSSVGDFAGHMHPWSNADVFISICDWCFFMTPQIITTSSALVNSKGWSGSRSKTSLRTSYWFPFRPASELEKSEICCGSGSEYTAIAFTFFGHLPAKAMEQIDLDFYREESRSTKRNEHGKERESSKRKRRMSSDIDKREW